MGGGGRSSSSSTQQSTNQSFDERIAATDDAIVVKDAFGTTIDRSSSYFDQDITAIDSRQWNDNSQRTYADARQWTDNRAWTSVTEVDNGAVDRAFDFAEAVSSDAGVAIGQSFDFALNAQAGALDLAEGLGQAVNATANRAFDFVENQNEEVGQDVIKTLVPWLVGAVVVIVIVQGWKR